MTKVQHLRITNSQHLNFIVWLLVTYESNSEILQNMDWWIFSNNSVINVIIITFDWRIILIGSENIIFNRKLQWMIWCSLYGLSSDWTLLLWTEFDSPSLLKFSSFSTSNIASSEWCCAMYLFPTRWLSVTLELLFNI